MDGQVIAISTAIVSPSGGSVGIGFATPSELIAPISCPVARWGGHNIQRGWPGVSVEDTKTGVSVAGVDNVPARPGARASSRPYDPRGQRPPHRNLARTDPNDRRGGPGKGRKSVDSPKAVTWTFRSRSAAAPRKVRAEGGKAHAKSWLC